MVECSAWTWARPTRAVANIGGGKCTRPAKFIGEDGCAYCAQHAKEPATVLRKASGQLRYGLKPIIADTGNRNTGRDDFGDYLADMRARADDSRCQ